MPAMSHTTAVGPGAKELQAPCVLGANLAAPDPEGSLPTHQNGNHRSGGAERGKGVVVTSREITPKLDLPSGFKVHEWSHIRA